MTAATALAAIAGIDGWLTDAQARRLWDAAVADRPAGAVVEIGSFHGRSTVMLALAVGDQGAVVAIDPHAGSDRGPQEIAADADRGAADHDAFTANLREAGVAGRVRHIRSFSDDAHAAVVGPLSLLYVDGAHRYRPALADIRDWGRRLAPGGTMLVHDSFSSIGVTLALLRECTPSSQWRYVGRSGSMAEYRRLAAPVPPRQRARDVARQLGQLPWFARNVLIKALVLARQERAARALGLPPGAPWPY